MPALSRWTFDPVTRTVTELYVNPAYCRLVALPAHELLARVARRDLPPRLSRAGAAAAAPRPFPARTIKTCAPQRELSLAENTVEKANTPVRCSSVSIAVGNVISWPHREFAFKFWRTEGSNWSPVPSPPHGWEL